MRGKLKCLPLQRSSLITELQSQASSFFSSLMHKLMFLFYAVVMENYLEITES